MFLKVLADLMLVVVG